MTRPIARWRSASGSLESPLRARALFTTCRNSSGAGESLLDLLIVIPEQPSDPLDLRTIFRAPGGVLGEAAVVERALFVLAHLYVGGAQERLAVEQGGIDPQTALERLRRFFVI